MSAQEPKRTRLPGRPQSVEARQVGSVSSHGDPADGGRADAIAASIRQAVIEHRLPPGTKLPEDQIGALFGASRTLVRVALQALAHDHIVVLARNKGACVASPSVEDARHLFDARRAIETILVRKAVPLLRSGDAASLATLIDEGRNAVLAADRGTAIRLSGEFHLGIGRVARQPVLQGFLAEMISRTSLVIALYGRSPVVDCGDVEHQALLDALLARDADRAASLMADHLAHIEADLDLGRHARGTLALAEALGRGMRPA